MNPPCQKEAIAYEANGFAPAWTLNALIDRLIDLANQPGDFWPQYAMQAVLLYGYACAQLHAKKPEALPEIRRSIPITDTTPHHIRHSIFRFLRQKIETGEWPNAAEGLTEEMIHTFNQSLQQQVTLSGVKKMLEEIQQGKVGQALA